MFLFKVEPLFRTAENRYHPRFLKWGQSKESAQYGLEGKTVVFMKLFEF